MTERWCLSALQPGKDVREGCSGYATHRIDPEPVTLTSTGTPFERNRFGAVVRNLEGRHQQAATDPLEVGHSAWEVRIRPATSTDPGPSDDSSSRPFVLNRWQGRMGPSGGGSWPGRRPPGWVTWQWRS